MNFIWVPNATIIGRQRVSEIRPTHIRSNSHRCILLSEEQAWFSNSKIVALRNSINTYRSVMSTVFEVLYQNKVSILKEQPLTFMCKMDRPNPDY